MQRERGLPRCLRHSLFMLELCPIYDIIQLGISKCTRTSRGGKNDFIEIYFRRSCHHTGGCSSVHITEKSGEGDIQETMRGLFVTVEGPDGSGKSTQVENIRKFFEDRGMDVILSREPGGTVIGERIRNIILDKELKEMDPMTEAMLYAASRAQHVAQVIAPALSQGKVVVCDRFVDSSLAYQGFGRGLGEAVAVINSYAIRDYMPDMTFLMKLDPEAGIHRIERSRAEQDRLEQEKLTFHKKVYEGFLELEKEHPDRIVGIDASLPKDRIRDLIFAKLEELLG